MKGTVYFYKNFPYHDGGTPTDKLLIVLNSGKTGNMLFLKTTSQQKGFRKKVMGCYFEDGYYFLPAKHDNFPCDTWVLFYIIERTHSQFLKEGLQKGVVEKKGQLRLETINAIIKCLKQTEDISEYHISQLD